MMWAASGVLAATAFVTLWACGGSETNASSSASPEGRRGRRGADYEVIEVTNGGKISGTVKWSGAPPARGTLEVTKDHETCGKTQPAQDLIVGADGGVKNVVVSIDDITKGAAFEAPEEPIPYDQKECVFLSHVMVVPAGATLKVLNSDNVLHNTNFTCVKNKPANLAIPAGKSTEFEVTKAETIKVSCDVHPWMTAHVIVRDNPYFAVTDEKGMFTIENIPPGKYKVSIWQEKSGKKAAPVKSIEVKAGEAAKADFVMGGS